MLNFKRRKKGDRMLLKISSYRNNWEILWLGGGGGECQLFFELSIYYQYFIFLFDRRIRMWGLHLLPVQWNQLLQHF